MTDTPKDKQLKNITSILWCKNIKHNVVFDTVECRVEVGVCGLILNEAIDTFREWFKAENVFVSEGGEELVYIEII